MRYGLGEYASPCSLKEVGRINQISSGRVRAIEQRAFNKMRKNKTAIKKYKIIIQTQSRFFNIQCVTPRLHPPQKPNRSTIFRLAIGLRLSIWRA